jgi:hypothetical protein
MADWSKGGNMRRKQEKKFVRKLIVGHLQKVIFFVSGLKFWNASCLILLIIANFIFHVNDNPKPSVSLPLYTFNEKNLPINSSEIKLPITNSFTELFVRCSNPPLNIKASSLLEPGTPNKLEIPPITADAILNGQNTNEPSGVSSVKNLDDPADKPISKKSRIVLAFLAFISIIEHVLPEKFLKNIVKIVKK